MNRRNFLKLGALFVPAVVTPAVVYSFLWSRSETRTPASALEELRRLQRAYEACGWIKPEVQIMIDGKRWPPLPRPVSPGSRILIPGGVL